MTRDSSITKRIYRRHLSLYRFLNDTFIFTQLMLPDLLKKVEEFEKSKSSTKRRYSVPKKGKTVVSRRRDSEIGVLLRHQYKRGIFESLLISIISRIEAHLQECVRVAIEEFPEKLAILADEKTGIPINVFLDGHEKKDILAEFVAMKCEGFLYLPPKKYIEKLEKILSVTIKKSAADAYLEAKASRDLVIHNSGSINSTYIAKAGKKARGSVGESLKVDEAYFQSVVDTTKAFAGNIMDGVEAKFG